jgi:hypothetical protein
MCVSDQGLLGRGHETRGDIWCQTNQARNEMKWSSIGWQERCMTDS